MDKDRWAKIAIEMQPHVEPLLRIAKREKLDIFSVSLYGTSEGKNEPETATLYIDHSDEAQYSTVRYAGENMLKIRKDGDDYRAFLQT